MDYKKIILKIDKGESQEDDVILYAESYEEFVLNLSKSDVVDIKTFFNNVFDYIIVHNTLIEFELNDSNDGELLHKVSLEIIEQLNSEIRDSESNFIELIRFNNEVSSEVDR